jgi:hypothetical protein
MRLLSLLLFAAACQPVKPPEARVAAATKPADAPSKPSKSIVDLRTETGETKPVAVVDPAWPGGPAPIVDVVIRLHPMDEELKQDVEIVTQIGSVSRQILTRRMGSTRMGTLCPSEKDAKLPKGEVIAFSDREARPVAWMTFFIGGVTTLSVLRVKAGELVVQVKEQPDGSCGASPCPPFVEELAVIPIPRDAKTRGRVFEVEAGGDVPFEFCPKP